MGISFYETYVSDGHTDYYGADEYKTSTESKYDLIAVAPQVNLEQFKADLKLHQQGGSDYPTFINHCAQYGIEKWAMDLQKMTCTYFDTEGNEVLAEQVPG